MTKKSIYTSVISLDADSVLIYNSLSDKYLSCPYSEWMKSEQGFDVSPRLASQLKEVGVLVEDDVDEVKLAKDRMEEMDNDNSVVHLHINPTLQCNVNCWYCYEKHVPFSKMNVDTVDAVRKYVKRRLDDLTVKHFQLSFFGGEPLLYFM